jgi:hypothetical protein
MNEGNQPRPSWKSKLWTPSIESKTYEDHDNQPR